jgi:acyl-homoserine-lactone acylase
MTMKGSACAGLVLLIGGIACGEDAKPAADSVAGAAVDADESALSADTNTADADTTAAPELPPGDAPEADVAPEPAESEAEILKKTPVQTKFAATVRWTAWGIPHISGADVGSVAFGQGYAFAKDNACYLADQVIKATSRRAEFFGPGTDDANLKTDFAYKALQVREQAVATYQAMSQPARDAVTGYVTGYNKRIKELGPKSLPQGCQDAPWVQPLTALDLLTYVHDVALLASGRNFRTVIYDAQPPPKQGSKMVPNWLRPWWNAMGAGRAQLAMAEELPDFNHMDIGSNGWAIGKQRSATGAGLVLANPHFPWFGELRFWESHLTIPGQMDVYGVNLYGLPGVAIGFTKDLAWTMTVSASKKFTIYRLTLDPTDPSAYVVDGQKKPMTSRTYTIQVKQKDGTLKPVARTFWRSHHGPILALGGVPWTAQQAFALRDGNHGNSAILDHFMGTWHAKTAAEAEKAFAKTMGNPWTNTMLADKDGAVLYSESNSTPNLSAAAGAAHKKSIDDATDAWAVLGAQSGAVVLDGSKAMNEWLEEPGARQPGLVPFAKTPHMLRDDYVLNANDSHWLTNLAAPLTGYGYLFGPEGTQRSPRTRMNLKLATEVTATGASGEDGKFTHDELAAVFWSGRTWYGDTYAPGAAAHCDAALKASGGAVKVKLDKLGRVCLEGKACDGGVTKLVDVTQACQVIAAWDRRHTHGSVGAVLMREWMAHVPVGLFYVPFDPKNPGLTPHTLKPPPENGENPVLLGLAAAIVRLQDHKLALDVPLGKAQYTLKGSKRLEVAGGFEAEGPFNNVGWAPRNDTRLPDMNAPQSGGAVYTALSLDGYPINYGSSFVMALAFTDQGPKVKALLTYGNAANPASPHFDDQTEQVMQKGQWRDVRFDEAAILADPALKTESVASE